MLASPGQGMRVGPGHDAPLHSACQALTFCRVGARPSSKLKVEKERGITVKAQTVSMIHKHEGKRYLLNLIDTPGESQRRASRRFPADESLFLNPRPR